METKPPYKVEADFKHEDYRCVVIASEMGHRCGYVGIGKDHPLYEVDFMEETSLYFNVHGGITFTGDGNGRYPVEATNIWWYGFDCAHGGDAKDPSIVKGVMPKCEYLFNNGEIRTKEYVVKECKSLAEQLKEKEETMTNEANRRLPIFKKFLRDAIRDGVKTQTRRVAKPQQECPYGKPGEIQVMPEPLKKTKKVEYKNCNGYRFAIPAYYAAYKDDGEYIWRPARWNWKTDVLSAMFMPKKYGRTFVKITDIRKERLHEITEQDAKQEGVEYTKFCPDIDVDISPDGSRSFAFRKLWDHIHGDGAFEQNPEVWVIEWELKEGERQ